jgi:hypothetical protein
MNVFAMHSDRRTAYRGRRMCTLVFGLTLGGFAASGAWAQIGGSGPAGTNSHVGRAANTPEKPPEPSPDAIPGAKPREAAAPATKPAGDMEPTDALFDAINRGDIAAARDALNRGADLDGVNILGMTPMELSVDLGRNNISFLLLSMRGEDSGRGSRAVGRDTPPSASSGKTVQAGSATKRGRSSPGKPGSATTVQAATIINRKPAATPKLFANDGGTPLPSAGFLGFGSRSASN